MDEKFHVNKEEKVEIHENTDSDHKQRRKTFNGAMDHRWWWCAWNVYNIDVSCGWCCCCSCCAIGTRMKPRCHTKITQLTRIYITCKNIVVTTTKNDFWKKHENHKFFTFFNQIQRVEFLAKSPLKKVCLCVFLCEWNLFLDIRRA